MKTMKSWRIVFYGLLVTGLFSIIQIYRRAISNFDSKENYNPSGIQHGVLSKTQSRSSAESKKMIFRRSTGQKISSPIVVAPWTIPAVKLYDSKSKKDKDEHRNFVFAETAKLDWEYGVPIKDFDRKEEDRIRQEASRRLCARSKKISQNAQPALRCNQNLEVLRCVSCSERDGTWYTAVSETGAVFAQVFNGTSLQFPNYNDGPFLYQQLDIAIPIAGQDDKLRRFAAKLGSSIKNFRSGMFGAKITIRLLVTRFSFDSPPMGTAELEEFRSHLAEASGLTDVADDVVFVEVKDSPEFSRAKAVNALHREAYHNDNSALALIDVDLSIGSKFLRNALTYPFPNGTFIVICCLKMLILTSTPDCFYFISIEASAYFPIMFSAYDPESVELVDQLIPRTKRNTFSDHHGHWRKFSFGMYVIAGSDAARLSMDENFVGWYVEWTRPKVFLLCKLFRCVCVCVY